MYSRTLRRRVRSPYLNIIRATEPYAAEMARVDESKKLEERGLALREKIEMDALAQRKKELAAQRKQALRGSIIQGAGVGAQGAYLGSKLFAPKAVTAALPKTLPAIPGVAPHGAYASSLAAGTTTAGTTAGGVAIPSAATVTTGGAAVPPVTGGFDATALKLAKPAGVAALEVGHQMLKPYASRWSRKLPGGEKEWKAGLKIATRAGQGAILAGPPGALIGGTIGAIETTYPHIEHGVKKTGREVERAGKKVGEESERVYKDVAKVGKKIGKAVSKGWKKLTGGCIIITAATYSDSYEVNVTREYRDRFMPRQMLRGYYMIAEKIVPLMNKSEWFKQFIKKHLVDHIVRYCEWAIGKRGKKPFKSSLITKTFLRLCNLTGSMAQTYVRNNGEVW